MALPDYFKREFGTAIIWGEAGASGVTNTLTFEALAAGSARQGAAVDLGAAWDDEYLVQIIIETGTAPTAGNAGGGGVDLYLACSRNNTTWPAGLGTSDAAWPADGNEDEWSLQLGTPVTTLIPTADGTTIQVQNPVIWRPSGRYVVPVVDNNMSQAIRDEATATNNDSRVILVPRRLLVQDTA